MEVLKNVEPDRWRNTLTFFGSIEPKRMPDICISNRICWLTTLLGQREPEAASNPLGMRRQDVVEDLVSFNGDAGQTRK
jgi:hypothetical protein